MKIRILDADIENRPLAYLGQEYTSGEITAIAACFVGEPDSMRCWLLGRHSPRQMLQGFRRLYDKADLVTGHYITMHDLPVINGAMLEHGLPPLSAKLVCDTKVDLVKHLYLSASQENLCEALGIPEAKVHMSNAKWREANRLTAAGLEYTKARAIGDVLQHMALRERLVELDMLNPPKQWTP